MISSFLTSIRGAHVLTTHGPLRAADFLTRETVISHIVAESALYLSIIFFFISVRCFTVMVYSGPDICPTYRGRSSFCARVGQDLVDAAEPVCASKCCKEGDLDNTCNVDDTPTDRLCVEYCREKNTWMDTVEGENPGANVKRSYWFGYMLPTELTQVQREDVIRAASDLMCNHELIEARKNSCFASSANDCNMIFMTWVKSEECLEQTILDAKKCEKVCRWIPDHRSLDRDLWWEAPPKKRIQIGSACVVLPFLGCLGFMTFGRFVLMTYRGIRACREDKAADQKVGAASPRDSDSSED